MPLDESGNRADKNSHKDSVNLFKNRQVLIQAIEGSSKKSLSARLFDINISNFFG